jgi:hypothetical protein
MGEVRIKCDGKVFDVSRRLKDAGTHIQRQKRAFMDPMRRDGIEEETVGKVEDDVLIKKPSIRAKSPVTKVCNGSPLIGVVPFKSNLKVIRSFVSSEYWSITTPSVAVFSERAETRRIKKMEPLTEP